MLLGALALAAPRSARADGPITDRDYAIDFYEGVAIGNTAWVGMGGAGAALIVGTAGSLINPSAPAVRPTTDTDTWSWDFHLDYLTGKYSSDYDNNGTVVDEDAGAQLLTFGIGIRYENWAAALTASGQIAPIFSATPEPEDDLEAGAARLRFAIATWVPSLDLAIGVGVQQVLFAVLPVPPPEMPGMSSQESPPSLFEISGTGIMGGVTYVPRLRNFRFAAALETKILGADVTSRCNPDDPADCMGYILPTKVVSPARVVVGFAYRFAETQWNQLVGGLFRDEPSLTLTADLLVTGSSPNAFGIEAFGMQQLQRSGRHTAVSLRGGAEYECLPGRLRLRAGSYWEPERFVDQGGRLHVTFGAELRVFEFNLWGRRRRGRLSFTADVASQYRNIAASIGFWH